MLPIAVALLALIVLVRISVEMWRDRDLGELTRIRSPESQARLDALSMSVEADRIVVGGYVRGAREHWQANRSEAIRRLDLACAHLDEFGPELEKALRAMRNMARAVSISASPRPLCVMAFTLWRLRGLGGVASVGHWVVVTGKERILVRLWFLRRAFGVVVRALPRRVNRAHEATAWDRGIDEAVADLVAVEREALHTYEVILAALDHWDATRRHAPVL